jgi:hypothetical protein
MDVQCRFTHLEADLREADTGRAAGASDRCESQERLKRPAVPYVALIMPPAQGGDDSRRVVGLEPEHREARGGACSGTTTQRGPDVLQARAVLAGVVPAEQQLAAGAQQRSYLRWCAAAVTAIVAGEYGRRGRDHFVTLPRSRHGRTR